MTLCPLELVSSMGESAKPFVKWVIFIPMIVVQKKAVGNLLADCTKGTPGVETEMDKRGYHTATGYPEIAQLLLTVALATVRRGCFFMSPKMETVARLTDCLIQKAVSNDRTYKIITHYQGAQLHRFPGSRYPHEQKERKRVSSCHPLHRGPQVLLSPSWWHLFGETLL